LSSTHCRDLLPTRCLVAATGETGEAKQEAEVVPGSVVVDLVDIEVAFEQRCHKDERRNKALPEPKPEARDHVVFARRSSELVRSRSTPSQNVQKQQDKHKQDKEDFIVIPYISLRSMGLKRLRMTVLATNFPESGLPASGGFWLAFEAAVDRTGMNLFGNC
jgi:hypothetical protein